MFNLSSIFRRERDNFEGQQSGGWHLKRFNYKISEFLLALFFSLSIHANSFISGVHVLLRAERVVADSVTKRRFRISRAADFYFCTLADSVQGVSQFARPFVVRQPDLGSVPPRPAQRGGVTPAHRRVPADDIRSGSKRPRPRSKLRRSNRDRD